MDDPVRVISTVQVGITAIGILTGAVAEPLVRDLTRRRPARPGPTFVIAFASRDVPVGRVRRSSSPRRSCFICAESMAGDRRGVADRSPPRGSCGGRGAGSGALGGGPSCAPSAWARYAAGQSNPVGFEELRALVDQAEESGGDPARAGEAARQPDPPARWPPGAATIMGPALRGGLPGGGRDSGGGARRGPRPRPARALSGRQQRTRDDVSSAWCSTP